MFGFSFGEIIFIGILALVVIGPKQLPTVARNIARFLNELKRASSGLTDEIKRQARVDLDSPIQKKPAIATEPINLPQTPNPDEPKKPETT